jgi:uncharacterized repeat protein (TIGR03803 family)
VRYLISAIAALAAAVTLSGGVISPAAQAQTFTTLYTFTGPPDGAWPYGGVIRDSAGSLYGVTSEGGSLACEDAYHPYGCGLVFKITPDGTETVLHLFHGGLSDGEFPFGPLLRDDFGNLYGTTTAGGDGKCWPYFGGGGCGVVFKIDTTGHEKVLYSFQGGKGDGCYPGQGLAMDKYGNLYGTTEGCGSSNYGTVFMLDTNLKESVLHSFTGTDGTYAVTGHPILDQNGDLYGVTDAGGAWSCGTLYKLTSQGAFTVLHSFGGDNGWDGCNPLGTPAMDSSGNIYGTTEGYTDLEGTVWRFSQDGTETALHFFYHTNQSLPESGVVLDSKGNMYGTTLEGGTYGSGTLWELSPNRTFTVLQNFPYLGSPEGDIVRDDNGGLYGTTIDGGDYGSVWSFQ